jgi:hypothetical protein
VIYEYKVISEHDFYKEYFVLWDNTPEASTFMESPASKDFREQFNETVKMFMADGWQLSGGVAVDSTGRLLQAVYRETED